MLKTASLAAIALACMIVSADARQRQKPTGLHPQCNITMPCTPSMSLQAVTEGQRVARGRHIAREMGFGGAIERRAVRAPKGRKSAFEEINLPANNISHLRTKTASKEINPSYGAPAPSLDYSIGRPARYIAGRLVCALNVGAALAERGIKGTGSALAKSYDGWGRSSGPQPGAVAVTDRRGGGHVAIVSRVEGGRVFVWNATGGRNGWHEIEYTGRHARYRVAG